MAKSTAFQKAKQSRKVALSSGSSQRVKGGYCDFQMETCYLLLHFVSPGTRINTSEAMAMEAKMKKMKGITFFFAYFLYHTNVTS
jgi:hypothetical protein